MAVAPNHRRENAKLDTVARRGGIDALTAPLAGLETKPAKRGVKGLGEVSAI